MRPRLFKTLPILLFLVTFLAFEAVAQTPDSTAVEDQQEATTTTLIFVRHAEKMDDGTDNPSLNGQGKDRADRLAQLLHQQYKIDAIYSTGYNRTLETATPTAEVFGLDVQEYGLDDPKGLIASIVKEYKGRTVLIVGHSNTTPYLVNIASGRDDFKQLDEKTYGKLFVVESRELYKGKVTESNY
ncbi:SixA phosphatase family protein [Gracilimonas mengyeensis]|nr:phosphoglycerate mutase family protein [Gracilimonas mengyeensis]